MFLCHLYFNFTFQLLYVCYQNIGDIKLKLKLIRIFMWVFLCVCVVAKNGHYCSLLEVTDRSRSTTSVTRLLQELEIKRVVSSDVLNLLSQVIFLSTLDSVSYVIVECRLFFLQVLVIPLTERGFLFLLSSVQMATPTGKT